MYKLSGFILVLLLSQSAFGESGSLVCRLFFAPEKPIHLQLLYKSNKESRTLSQVIRDNGHHFWGFVKSSNKSAYKKYLKFKGWVVGDAHPGNFLFMHLGGKFSYELFDLKDVGKGAMAGDILRLVMTTWAVNTEKLNLRKAYDIVMQSYIPSVKGEKRNENYDDYLKFDLSAKDYLEKRQGYFKKFITKVDGFKSTNVLWPYSQLSFRDQKTLERIKENLHSHFESNYPGFELMDMAVRLKTRGGSKNFKRYWFLLEKNGEYEIVELKEVREPAAAKGGELQVDAAERYEFIKSQVWKRDDSRYTLIKDIDKEFEVRPKKFEAMNFSYKQNSVDGFLRFLSFAKAASHSMGRIHSKNSAEEFAKLIESDPDAFYNDFILPLSKEYINILKSENPELRDKLKAQPGGSI